MANRLDPINLVDFTGGLNTRSSPFQLGENETPESLNIAVDRLGGIYSRDGWECWNTGQVWEGPSDEWDPRRAYMHTLSDGTSNTYLAANGTLLCASASTTFEDLELPCEATTHLADFAVFGDTIYIARGRELAGVSREFADTPVVLTAAAVGNWNADYTGPIGGVMPQAELCESHGGYLFVANTEEDGADFPNRVRWSHPTSQTDWAQTDYIDILSEGSKITALISFQDHLLVFKSDGVWAIYGYSLDSWQVIKKSTTVGAPGPQAVTRSEVAVFFYSASDGGSVYAYTGEMPQEVSPQLRLSFGEINDSDLVWVGWMRRKLWVTVPWNYDGAQDDSVGVFVYDPAVGENGCWMYYESGAGGLGPLVGGSNINSSVRPMGVLRNSDTPCVLLLDAVDDFAYDKVGDTALVAAMLTSDPWNPTLLLTDDGGPGALAILASGMPGLLPYRTTYRTPWLTAGWPTRKKSFRRPDFVCRRTGITHQLRIQSYRDYEEVNPRRQHTLQVDSQGLTLWGAFDWTDAELPGDDPPLWGAGRTTGNKISRGNSFGLCRSLQVRIMGNTPGARWGIDAIVMKLVLRRFH